MSNRIRRIRFLLLEKAVLPLAGGPMRLLVRSWRAHGGRDPNVQELLAAPRVVLTTWHGMFVHLLAYAPLVLDRGRRLVVLVSPSLDGRLLAAALGRFGIEHVFGAGISGGIGGSREFVTRIAAGDVGVVAADGPRGPCCVAKPGVLEIAALADARIYLTVTSAKQGLILPAWDRSHLPPPFAPLTLAVRPFVAADETSLPVRLAAMESELLALSRSIASPILPPALR